MSDEAAMNLTLESEATRAFAAIESETTPRDRQSLVALQRVVRRSTSSYVYLEIGSHLGGTLQPFVADPACAAMWSIDSRPAVQADERGVRWPYPDNSTARMLANLRRVDPHVEDRLRCIDSEVGGVDCARLDPPPQLLFVDGEHTDAAVQADAEFCRRVGDPQGSIIAFHDSHIVYRGLAAALERWRLAGVDCTALLLPDCVTAVAFGDFAVGGSRQIVSDPDVQHLLVENHAGYLWSLLDNDGYRQTVNRFPAKHYMRGASAVRALCRRLNVAHLSTPIDWPWRRARMARNVSE